MKASGHGWQMLAPSDDDPMAHVSPVGDEREHELRVTKCWCHPRIMVEDDDGTLLQFPIVVHNSQDCREMVEWAQEILDTENGKILP